jgi:hypothetical protein
MWTVKATHNRGEVETFQQVNEISDEQRLMKLIWVDELNARPKRMVLLSHADYQKIDAIKIKEE